MAWLAENLADLAALARRGDAAALDSLLRELSNPIFGLAMRMLGGPEDAADASQEILLRIATNLDSFRGESSFATWVYRVAANQLLTARTRHREARAGQESFEQASDELAAALAASAGRSSDDRRLIEEVKLFCTHGMLLCLDREHRLAYILGEILELTSEEGAAILDITPEAFRKRLSRARASLGVFLRDNCGLVNASCACRCAKLVEPSIELGLLDPQRLRFASQPTRQHAERLRDDIEVFAGAAELFRSQPRYVAPAGFAQSMRQILAARTI